MNSGAVRPLPSVRSERGDHDARAIGNGLGLSFVCAATLPGEIRRPSDGSRPGPQTKQVGNACSSTRRGLLPARYDASRAGATTSGGGLSVCLMDMMILSPDATTAPSGRRVNVISFPRGTGERMVTSTAPENVRAARPAQYPPFPDRTGPLKRGSIQSVELVSWVMSVSGRGAEVILASMVRSLGETVIIIQRFLKPTSCRGGLPSGVEAFEHVYKVEVPTRFASRRCKRKGSTRSCQSIAASLIPGDQFGPDADHAERHRLSVPDGLGRFFGSRQDLSAKAGIPAFGVRCEHSERRPTDLRFGAECLNKRASNHLTRPPGQQKAAVRVRDQANHFLQICSRTCQEMGFRIPSARCRRIAIGEFKQVRDGSRVMKRCAVEDCFTHCRFRTLSLRRGRRSAFEPFVPTCAREHAGHRIIPFMAGEFEDLLV